MYNRNVRLFYAYRLTKFAVFHVSVLVLFYQARGLSFLLKVIDDIILSHPLSL